MILRYLYIALIGLGLFLSQSGVNLGTSSSCEITETSCCHVQEKDCCGCDQSCQESVTLEHDQFQVETNQLIVAGPVAVTKFQSPYVALSISNTPIAFDGTGPKLRRVLMGSLVFYG